MHMRHPILSSMPVDKLGGELDIPGDKSMSHRAIMLGSIAEGITTITGFLESEDCLATLKAMQMLGVTIHRDRSQLRICGVGKYGLRADNNTTIDCGNSGTSMRLLAGLLSAQPFGSVLIGDESLSKRPMARVCDPLVRMGAEIRSHAGFAPLIIHANKKITGIFCKLQQPSAQVKSALLLAGLYAEGKTTVSEPCLTRDHTERLLQTLQYPIIRSPDVVIESQHQLQGTHIEIPGDFSSAAFFIVAATLMKDASLVLKKVGINPTRIGLWYILKAMGADITLYNHRQINHEPVADIAVNYAPLHGIEIPAAWVSIAIDEFPIILLAAACAQGVTRLQQAQELRYKESDRIVSMKQGLQALNVAVTETPDGLIVIGGRLRGGEVDAQHDHRVAMTFLIAGAVAENPVVVLNCETISTSFPAFIAKANSIGLDIRTHHREI